MDIEHQPLQERIEHFKDVLRRSGLKATHQRLEIFREAGKSEEHPDAEAIFKAVRARIPTISLDTVYRTLWLFVDLGLLSALGPPRQRVRFDANMTPHHHFFCRKCSRMLDFYSTEFDRLIIPMNAKALGKVEAAQVEIRGLCSRCSA
jgi:Fur family transcriptional regulator, peroxide stress response regulator